LIRLVSADPFGENPDFPLYCRALLRTVYSPQHVT
jgi:hypothetical protein